MRVFVTGAKATWDVVKELQLRKIDCIGTDIGEFDITEADSVTAFISDYRPDVVIHCAAYTAVDKAEDEPEICRDVNAMGTRNIAAACREIDAKMIYISTDYVFSGSGDREHETDDPTGPLAYTGDKA